MKGLIVVHGTAQDSCSSFETTVKIAKAARAEGYFVIELGGPGSTERAILRGIERNPDLAEYTPIDEIGLPLDYVWDFMSGIASGSGIQDIVRDILAAGLSMQAAGVTSIDLVGFSRGAVAIALALQEAESKGVKLPAGSVNACLLDPVPGPFFVPQRLKIPAFVGKCMVLTSKHEGRLGFRNPEITLSEGVRLEADIVMGVHGDIGGSTQSPIAQLAMDQVARFIGLSALRLGYHERLWLATMATLDGPKYTNPGPLQWMSRRGIGWSGTGHEHSFENLEFPSARTGSELMRAQRQDLDMAFTRFGRDWQPRQPRPPMPDFGLVVPASPILDRSNQLRFPPSTFLSPRHPGVQGFVKGMVSVLSRGRIKR